MTPPRKAWLFDLDGTLIDSMPLHQAAWARWFASVGLPFDAERFFASTAGRTTEEIIAHVLPGHSAAEVARMGEDKEALYRAMAAERLAMIDGALALLQAARAAGLKLAICTASPSGNLAVAYQRFGLQHLVDTVTSPSDGLRGKPHPDIFEEAARRLDVAPADCLVFEDAPLGVEAARRAGMPAFALTTTLPAEAFAAWPNLVGSAPDFTGPAIGQLLQERVQRTCHA